MIIILEGLNGVGKSAVASELKRMGVIIWRPFRTNSDIHLGHDESPELVELKNVGVPLNTFVDDLYVADALSTLEVAKTVALDRSLPTAIAYTKTYAPNTNWLRKEDYVWRVWRACLRDAFWIHLEAPWQVTRARCENRWHPTIDEWTRMNSIYEGMIEKFKSESIMVQGGVTRVNATIDPSEIARRIVRRFGNRCNRL